MLSFYIDWLKARIKERTSWDGATIIAVSLIALLATPILKYAAIAGLAYGIWTFWKSE